jgi:hypothetical protein
MKRRGICFTSILAFLAAILAAIFGAASGGGQ